ncbi:MAG: high-potential iron-sulfur protein [Bdellovibrionales bacterium]
MQNNRRDFLKLSVLWGTAGLIGSQLLTWGQKTWAAGLQLVDPTKTKRKDPENEAAMGILSGIGYVHDADQAEKEKKITRVDKDWAGGKFPAKKQYCTNCILLEEADLNTNKPGKCQLVATALVNGKGYCGTYNVSPKAKI